MEEERPGEFAQLIGEVNAGSEEAARILFERYGPHILRVVRRKLDKKLRTRFDSLDFVQDVWTSFFAERTEPLQFDRPEALVTFLARMARNKVIEAYRRRVLTKRQGRREHSLDSVTVTQTGGLADARETPSQLVGSNEQWERLLEEQPAPYRRILVMLRMGYSHHEIATQLGIHEKTVQRLLRRVTRRQMP
jgi:RNA polymerase sigma-70 factor (ECF subfamily)